MKPKIYRLSVVWLFLFTFFVLMSVGCDSDELAPHHARGKIIAVTGGCYLDVVLIEVEDPKGIGNAGHFSTIGNEIDVTYNNAINVPYFSKIGIPDSVPQIVGTELYFEYREITEEEKEESSLFVSNPAMICLAIYGPPSGTPMIIEKIISYK